MPMKVKFFSDLTKDGDYLRFVDFVSDKEDIITHKDSSVNSHSVCMALEQCGVVGPWSIIDGDVLEDGVQYITVALENPEDYVKIKLLMPELDNKNQYKKEDLTC